MMKLPKEILKEVAGRARAVRLEFGYTQESLATHSGVSFGSIKRFENTGQISLESLLKIALILGSLEDFDSLFKTKQPQGINSLDNMLKSVKKRKRGVK
jgi:transcriptional regulator with XRE-family HTH domain